MQIATPHFFFCNSTSRCISSPFVTPLQRHVSEARRPGGSYIS